MKSGRLYWLGLCAMLLHGCGGGGGGGGSDGNNVDPPEIPPTILSSYNFEIGGLQEGTDMRVDVGGQFQVDIDLGDTLLGNVDLQVNSVDDVTFLSYVTNPGSTIDVTVSRSQTPLDGTFTLEVTSTVNAVVDEQPTSGAFEVVTATETVTVALVADGVELSLNGAEVLSLGWEEFGDLIDDEQAVTWHRRAAVAAGVFAFVFDRFFEFADLLDDLEAALVNPVVVQCDMFPTAPPEGVVNAQGEFVVTRLGSGEDLFPGDVFDLTFTECWFASSDVLLNGFIQLQNYIEDIDASNTLTRIGFGPDNNLPGGVVFLGWTLAETEESGGVYTIDPEDVLLVEGGFTMVFTAP